MKLCFKCQMEKPLDAFYAHPLMRDGFMGKCKECVKAAVRQRAAENPEMLRQYDAFRNQKPARRRDKRRYSQEHYARYPEKRAARVAVGNAVRDGRLIKQPCEVCADPKSEAHHPDYAKPMDVRWLCLPHHREADRAGVPF